MWYRISEQTPNPGTAVLVRRCNIVSDKYRWTPHYYEFEHDITSLVEVLPEIIPAKHGAWSSTITPGKYSKALENDMWQYTSLNNTVKQ